MAMRNRIARARIERELGGSLTTIRQRDDSILRFTGEEWLQAWASFVRRMDGSDEVPEHPMITACRNSSDERWQRYLFSSFPREEQAEIMRAHRESAKEE